MESNRESLVRVINRKSSVEQFLEQLPEVLKDKKSGTTINVTVNLLQDPSDRGNIYPMEHKMKIPNSFFMFFKEAESFLFHMRNNLTFIDLYTYFALAGRFARDKQFTTSTYLWKDIEKTAAELGRNYKLISIRQSFYKLVKSSLIIKVSPDRSVYAINKALAFHGSLNTRDELIKQDFHNATMTDAKNEL